MPNNNHELSEGDIVERLNNHRKKLVQTRLINLLDGSVSPLMSASCTEYRDDRDKLSSAIDLAIASYPDACRIGLLSYLLTFFLQLKATLIQNQGRLEAGIVIEQIHLRLAPALLPGGSLAILIIESLESTDKASRLRARDVLAAVCRMGDSLPAPASSGSSLPSILAPMFRSIVRGGVWTRSSLVAVNSMIEHVPSQVIPEDLLDNLLRDLGSIDSASVRCSVILHLLTRRRGPEGADDEGIWIQLDNR